MSSFAESFDVPVPFKEYGLDLEFPKLDLDDHAKWCAELHEARKPGVLKMIPGNATPADRFKMQRNAEYAEPTLDDVADLLYTPRGARTCLDKSLAKAGKTADERTAILKKIPPGRCQRLALDVSGLFERVPPQQQAGEPPLSQAQSQSTPTSAPGVIGDGQDSSSASTSPNPSAE